MSEYSRILRTQASKKATNELDLEAGRRLDFASLEKVLGSTIFMMTANSARNNISAILCRFLLLLVEAPTKSYRSEDYELSLDY